MIAPDRNMTEFAGKLLSETAASNAGLIMADLDFNTGESASASDNATELETQDSTDLFSDYRLVGPQSIANSTEQNIQNGQLVFSDPFQTNERSPEIAATGVLENRNQRPEHIRLLGSRESHQLGQELDRYLSEQRALAQGQRQGPNQDLQNRLNQFVSQFLNEGGSINELNRALNEGIEGVTPRGGLVSTPGQGVLVREGARGIEIQYVVEQGQRRIQLHNQPLGIQRLDGLPNSASLRAAGINLTAGQRQTVNHILHGLHTGNHADLRGAMEAFHRSITPRNSDIANSDFANAVERALNNALERIRWAATVSPSGAHIAFLCRDNPQRNFSMQWSQESQGLQLRRTNLNPGVRLR